MAERSAPRAAPKRRSRRASLTRVWLIRLGIAVGIGLAIGAGAGVATVNTLEPGHPAQPDSLQLMLDSIARGTAPAAARPPAAVAPARAPESTPAADTAIAGGMVEVPDLIGLDEGAARSALARENLVAGGMEFRSSRSPAGTVLATLPLFGDRVPAGTAIALVLSDGRPPADSL